MEREAVEQNKKSNPPLNLKEWDAAAEKHHNFEFLKLWETVYNIFKFLDR